MRRRLSCITSQHLQMPLFRHTIEPNKVLNIHRQNVSYHPLPVPVFFQEKRLLEEGGSEKTPELYYVPTSADAFVSAYRVWLKRFAGGGVQYPDYVENKLPETPSKEVMLDR